MQQLSLPSLNVANSSNADKAIKSVANNKENDSFASELDRRVTQSEQSAKDKTAKTDSGTESKHTEKTDKAEKTEASDGKKLPPEKSDKTSETKSGAESDKADSEQTANINEEVSSPVVLSATPLADVTDEKKPSDQNGVSNKIIPAIADQKTEKTAHEVIASITKPITQTAGMEASKTNNAESPANSIRADILQAIKKQGGEGDAIVTEKVKSLMQNAGKMSQQMNVASAEVIASMRQLEPQTERSSAAKLSNPLAFSAISGIATPVAGAPSVSSPALSLDIQPQLNNAAWGRVMSSRVVWMAREGVQQAELRLNPAHLGPVEVRLSMQNEQTSVTFIASNAAARDALEQALPRLRESFSENGLALNHAEVSHQEQSSHGSKQDEQLQDGNNTTQVIIEMDDMDDEAARISADSTENSVGVSVFA